MLRCGNDIVGTCDFRVPGEERWGEVLLPTSPHPAPSYAAAAAFTLLILRSISLFRLMCEASTR